MIDTMTNDQLLRIVNEDSAPEVSAFELRPEFKRRTSSFSPNWSGLVAGITPPRWWNPDLLISGDALNLYTLKNAYYAPGSGAVISSGGELFSIPARQATYPDPKLDKLNAIWSRRASASSLKKGTVTMSWGAQYNFGHFLLDSLTAVAAVTEFDFDRNVSLVTPKLHEWQREHFKLLQLQPIELPDAIYHFDELSFTSGMRGSLHNPNLHFQTLRNAQLSRAELSCTGPRRIYVSRRGQKRRMLNEEELEDVLTREGFVVVQPEQLSIRNQIQIFNSADVIVAPTGAALANLLYSSGAIVVEIIPRDMTLSDTAHKWVAFLTAFGEGDWRPFFCDDLPDSKQTVIAGQPRAGYQSFQVPVAEIMSFIPLA